MPQGQGDIFVMVYGIFLRDTHLEVALVPTSSSSAASTIHRALRAFDGVGSVIRNTQRGIVFFNVTPEPGVELIPLSQRLADHMDLAAPQEVACILGPALSNSGILECAGVIYPEPDPTMHVAIDTLCEFTQVYIGPTEVVAMRSRGFVITVEAGKNRINKPTLVDALSFVQFRPEIETIGRPLTVSEFVQEFVGRLRQQ